MGVQPRPGLVFQGSSCKAWMIRRATKYPEMEQDQEMPDDNEFTVMIVKDWDIPALTRLYRAGGWWNEDRDLPGLSRLVASSFAFAIAVHRGERGDSRDGESHLGRSLGCLYTGPYRPAGVQGHGGRPDAAREAGRCLPLPRDHVDPPSLLRPGNNGLLQRQRVRANGRARADALQGDGMLKISQFQPVTMGDRDVFSRHYAQNPPEHSDNLFSNILCWNHFAHYTYAEHKNCLVISSTVQGVTTFRPPIGPRDREALLDVI